MGDGDDDQDDEEPGPLASSTSDPTSGTQVQEEQHAGVPLRRIRAGELRWEEFLYELKAGLRAAASGGRPRPTTYTRNRG